MEQLLIPVVLCGVVFIIGAILWYLVLGRSMRALVMTTLAILLNRDQTVDPDAPIEVPENRETAGDKLINSVEERDFIAKTGLPKTPPRIPSSNASFSSNTRFSAQSTSDEGRGARVGQQIPKSIRRLGRPFRFLRVSSHNEDGLLDDDETSNDVQNQGQTKSPFKQQSTDDKE